MIKATIIVPTYNVQGYINQCIDSILNQTEQDFEVILIDDCSSDKTIQIIKEYKDPRIKLFQNEKNSGPSHSRNRGLNIAQGEYVFFLDSDDWWSHNRLESLLTFASGLDADMVCDDQFLINDKQDKPWSTIFQNGNILITSPLRFDSAYFINNDLGIKPMIKRKFIEEYNIRFNEDLRYGEDYVLFLECLINGASAWLLPEAYYYYRAREGSLITYNTDLLQQTFNTTKRLLENPLYQQGDVQKALLHRQKRIKEAITYYSFTQPIKNGEYLKGIGILLSKPYGFWLIAKRFPKVLQNRVVRPLLKNM